MSVLSLQNISKNYGAVKAVNQLTLDIPAGCIYGILGPNGSGKTTTLGMVLGVIPASSGTYSWFGKPASAAVRKKIGTILEQPNFYPYLSATQNLEIACLVKEVPYSDIDRVLDLTGLLERKGSKVQTYSLGMKQRLALATALLGDPEVLVLDEPTNGLDPQGIAEIRSLILALGRQGKTILFASHILDEVEKTCTHVAILKKGTLLAAGEVGAIISPNDSLIMKADNLQLLQAVLGTCPLLKNVQQKHDTVVANFVGESDSAAVNQFLFEKGMVLAEMYVQRKSLESQFLEITK